MRTKPVSIAGSVLDAGVSWHLAWLTAIAAVGARYGDAATATLRLTGAGEKTTTPSAQARQVELSMESSFVDATGQCAAALADLLGPAARRPGKVVLAELALHGWTEKPTPVRVVMSGDAAPSRQTLERAVIHRDTALWLWLVDSSPIGLQLTAEYRRDLFAARSVRKLLSDVETLLEAAQVDPTRTLRGLPYLRKTRG